jgi:hypothetical protein
MTSFASHRFKLCLLLATLHHFLISLRLIVLSFLPKPFSPLACVLFCFLSLGCVYSISRYGMSRDDFFETLAELRLPMGQDPFSAIDSKTKSAFTRKYNQGTHRAQVRPMRTDAH